jgi:hypothetical protein
MKINKSSLQDIKHLSPFMGLEEGIHHLCKIKLLKIYRCRGIMVVDYGLMLILSVYWKFRRKSIESRIVGK